MGVLNVSVASKCCSSRFQKFKTLLSATSTSVNSCTPCRAVIRHDHVQGIFESKTKELTALSRPRWDQCVCFTKSVHHSVVLSCGTNMFQGMVERMFSELNALVHIITVGAIRFHCAEVFFFQPSF